MDYVRQLMHATEPHKRQACTASVLLALRTDDGRVLAASGDTAWHLPAADLQVGEGFEDCARRIAARFELQPPALQCLGTLGTVLPPTGSGFHRFDLQAVVTATVHASLTSTLQPVAMAEATAGWDGDAKPLTPSAADPQHLARSPFPAGREGEPYWRHLRRLVGADTCLILPAVAVIILTDNGRVVLVRSHEHDVWMIPGGIIDFGESVADAVVREAHEETGLAVTPAQQVGCYSGKDFTVRYKSGDVVQIASFPCVARVNGGALRTGDPGQIAAVAAFDPRHLPPMYPHWRRVLDDALAGHFGTVR